MYHAYQSTYDYPEEIVSSALGEGSDEIHANRVPWPRRDRKWVQQSDGSLGWSLRALTCYTSFTKGFCHFGHRGPPEPPANIFASALVTIMPNDLVGFSQYPRDEVLVPWYAYDFRITVVPRPEKSVVQTKVSFVVIGIG